MDISGVNLYRMVAVTFHPDMVTVVAEGDDCCETIDQIINDCECEVIDRTHHGVSCSVRLLSGYLGFYDTEDITTFRGGQL